VSDLLPKVLVEVLQHGLAQKPHAAERGLPELEDVSPLPPKPPEPNFRENGLVRPTTEKLTGACGGLPLLRPYFLLNICKVSTIALPRAWASAIALLLLLTSPLLSA